VTIAQVRVTDVPTPPSAPVRRAPRRHCTRTRHEPCFTSVGCTGPGAIRANLEVVDACKQCALALLDARCRSPHDPRHLCTSPHAARPMIPAMTKNFGKRVARKLSFSLIGSGASYALVFVIESTTPRSLPRRPPLRLVSNAARRELRTELDRTNPQRSPLRTYCVAHPNNFFPRSGTPRQTFVSHDRRRCVQRRTKNVRIVNQRNRADIFNTTSFG